MEYKDYSDFVKVMLKAVAVPIAQPQMRVGAVLEKKLIGGFVRVGNLSGLCGDTTYKEEVRSDLAKVETLEHPFAKETSQEQIEGFWKASKSGFLGVVVPNTVAAKAWVKSHAILKITVSNITTHYLKDDYLLDIINNGKWIPNVDSLKDLYVINEVVLTGSIKISLRNGISGGAVPRIDLPFGPVEAGLTYSQDADGTLNICGVMENGHRKPFPIAFRSAHIVYKKDFKLKRPMHLGVRRGKDGGPHISEFVGKDEKYHIGEFFLNTDEDEEVDIIPITLDDNSMLTVAEES